MSKSTTVKTINISLPIALVQVMDTVAKEEFGTRSDFIRDAILRKLRAAPDRWETVTDFTAIQKGGVDIDELLKRLYTGRYHDRQNHQRTGQIQPQRAGADR